MYLSLPSEARLEAALRAFLHTFFAVKKSMIMLNVKSGALLKSKDSSQTHLPLQ